MVAGQPAADAVRTGVVGGGSQHRGAVVTLQQLVEIGAAEADVLVGLQQYLAAAVAYFQCPCGLFAGGGHQLHQAQSTDRRACFFHEGAFLANDAVDQRRVQVILSGVAENGFPVRQRKAQGKIGPVRGFGGGKNGAVVPAPAVRQQCSQLQLAVWQ